MRKIAILGLVVALAGLSTLAFAKEKKGPWKAVFTVDTETAVNRSRKKTGTDFWASEDVSAACNQLEAQGYEIKQMCQAGERVLILARKK